MALYKKVFGRLVKINEEEDKENSKFSIGDKVMLVGSDVTAVVKSISGKQIKVQIKKPGSGLMAGDITSFFEEELVPA